MTTLEVPIFPLNTVLFPGGPLPLRLFEPRYIDMISHCMKTETPFGVVLIHEGSEAGQASTFDVGTLATIVDWYQGSDGLLGVTAVGGQRFRLIDVKRQPDGLNIGTIELIPAEAAMPIPDEYRPLRAILENVLDDLGRLYETLDRNVDDAAWLGYRFVEILPIDLVQKQQQLESSDTLARLELVNELVSSASA
ncbi:MAG: LON peptidase substrate-binding domain-containing protein [Gammaproteobacteria bacterium]|nr:LON peptidase substrate-binding domain-containing protein [Gammaproteobacteria bacterium]